MTGEDIADRLRALAIAASWQKRLPVYDDVALLVQEANELVAILTASVNHGSASAFRK
jgi:hypothetical protein